METISDVFHKQLSNVTARNPDAAGMLTQAHFTREMARELRLIRKVFTACMLNFAGAQSDRDRAALEKDIAEALSGP